MRGFSARENTLEMLYIFDKSTGYTRTALQVGGLNKKQVKVKFQTALDGCVVVYSNWTGSGFRQTGRSGGG